MPILTKSPVKRPSERHTPDYVFFIVTGLLELPAELIALLYRFRRQIELFFRWFKCILGCKHFLSLSEKGLAIQVYCAPIVSLLISLWSGGNPDKRIYEIFCLPMQDKELEEHLTSLKTR